MQAPQTIAAVRLEFSRRILSKKRSESVQSLLPPRVAFKPCNEPNNRSFAETLHQLSSRFLRECRSIASQLGDANEEAPGHDEECKGSTRCVHNSVSPQPCFSGR